MLSDWNSKMKKYDCITDRHVIAVWHPNEGLENLEITKLVLIHFQDIGIPFEKQLWISKD